MGELRTMGSYGDTRMLWDPNNDDEVTAARRTFDDLKAKRYNAYRVGEGGKQGELIRTFDPSAGKIIMAPPQAGGAPNELAEGLWEARDLIASEPAWTKGANCKQREYPGETVNPSADDPVETLSFCTQGAIVYAFARRRGVLQLMAWDPEDTSVVSQALMLVAEAALELGGVGTDHLTKSNVGSVVTGWNDDAARRHEEVLLALEKAATRAEELVDVPD